MYDKKFISVTSQALDLPVTNCHTFSDPLPLECDVLYGRPQSRPTRRIIDQRGELTHGPKDIYTTDYYYSKV